MTRIFEHLTTVIVNGYENDAARVAGLQGPGAQGWELVTCYPSKKDLVCIWKRHQQTTDI